MHLHLSDENSHGLRHRRESHGYIPPGSPVDYMPHPAPSLMALPVVLGHGTPIAWPWGAIRVPDSAGGHDLVEESSVVLSEPLTKVLRAVAVALVDLDRKSASLSMVSGYAHMSGLTLVPLIRQLCDDGYLDRGMIWPLHKHSWKKAGGSPGWALAWLLGAFRLRFTAKGLESLSPGQRSSVTRLPRSTAGRCR